MTMAGQRLIDSLTHLLHVQRQLYELAREKTDLLTRNDMQRLDELVKSEAHVVHKLEKAEEKRQQAVQQLLEENGDFEEDITLTALYPFLSEEEQEKAASIQKELTSELIRLQTQNGLNQELTERSLQYVNASLAMIVPEPASATYEHPEHKKQEVVSRRSFFDSKA